MPLTLRGDRFSFAGAERTSARTPSGPMRVFASPSHRSGDGGLLLDGSAIEGVHLRSSETSSTVTRCDDSAKIHETPNPAAK